MIARHRFVCALAALVLCDSCVMTSTKGPFEEAEGHWYHRSSDSAAAIQLGAMLFFDRRFSRDEQLSCASCHIPQYAFAEPRATSHGIGVDARRRNAPSLLNARFWPLLDWDGRARSLEDQASRVFSVSGDMGIDLGDAVAVAQWDERYRQLFLAAYGAPPNGDNLLRALASFQRSLDSKEAPFDAFFLHGDTLAISRSAQRGWKLFQEQRLGCIDCHSYQPAGSNRALAQFTDRRFHNLGVGFANGWMTDVGRFAQSRTWGDWGSFRTPSLRNVAMTAPYMHDGSLATLRDVLQFYSRRGIDNPNRDPGLMEFSLSDSEASDLVAFLEALTSPEYSDTAAVAKRWYALARGAKARTERLGPP